MSDFSNSTDASGTFTIVEAESSADFIPTGDFGVIVVQGNPFGEGGLGEGPFGGVTSVIVSGVTEWTNIGTP